MRLYSLVFALPWMLFALPACTKTKPPAREAVTSASTESAEGSTAAVRVQLEEWKGPQNQKSYATLEVRAQVTDSKGARASLGWAPIGRADGRVGFAGFKEGGEYTVWLKPRKGLAQTMTFMASAGRTEATLPRPPFTGGDLLDHNYVEPDSLQRLATLIGGCPTERLKGQDCPSADLNGDGISDDADVQLLLDHQGQKGDPALFAEDSPPPTSGLLSITRLSPAALGAETQ